METSLLRLALAFVLAVPIAASAAPLSPESTRVRRAFESLQAHRGDRQTQDAYLAAFPHDSATFLAVFMSPDFGQLYEQSFEEIDLLRGLGDSRPNEVLDLAVRISTHMRWDADAVNFLQHLIVSVAILHPAALASALAKLSIEDQAGAIFFLADGPHGPTRDYLRLVGAVESAGNSPLAVRLRVAGDRRAAKGRHGT